MVWFAFLFTQNLHRPIPASHKSGLYEVIWAIYLANPTKIQPAEFALKHDKLSKHEPFRQKCISLHKLPFNDGKFKIALKFSFESPVTKMSLALL